ncbi:MAG TPA: helix-turn-helix transcriptional regulator [Chryseolinea sp.]|nr:helix-turn-helix transcriptional regulator [Chryseolinea sp.]
MSFGKRLLEARKRKGISQDELAQHLGTKGPVVGRYERDEMKPSIEVAAKMAELLDVSLDFLAGKTDVLIDGKILTRITEIQKLSADEQKTVFSLLDAFLRDTKTRKAYAS